MQRWRRCLKRLTLKPVPPRMACDPAPFAAFASLETYDKGHGRLEPRRYYQSIASERFADLEQWEGPRSVGMVESIRDSAGKVTMERATTSPVGKKFKADPAVQSHPALWKATKPYICVAGSLLGIESS